MKFDAKHEASTRLKIMLEKCREFGGKVSSLTLSDYADAETYNFLLVKPGWTFEEWHAVNTELVRQLQANGFTVVLIKLKMGEFFEWLARYKLRNNTENRAQFCAWKSAPENSKPTPLPD